MPSFARGGANGNSFYPVVGSHSFLGARGSLYPRAAAGATTFQSVNRTFFVSGAGTVPKAEDASEPPEE